MPNPVSKKFLQLAYKEFDREPAVSKFYDGCRPVNSGLPIPIGPPKRDPDNVAPRWKSVDTIRLRNGMVYEVGIRRLR